MAKIDELSELLIEELSDFKLQINKLEAVSNEIQSMVIKPDISELKSYMDAALQLQNEIVKDQNLRLGAISNKLTDSNRYPKWLVGLLSLSLMAILLVTGYSIYQLQRIPEMKQLEYEKGRKEMVDHFYEFLESDAPSKKAYLKWKSEENVP
ncbi:DUF6730 family protein [Cellulophaga baltica]|uniref:Uncharacterized protein n=1 Tax=Cellulophaga baltica TaxID=76594 RepID=A0A1G7D7R2_9FLAO|nr:DUF6730 family protein [Cellulophaga baltica]SDE46966.1 hypothetical protein SAMN04487992_101369 [Cellulophaga baltica]